MKEGFLLRNYDSYEKNLFDEIIKQAEADPTTEWGKNINLLLISDNAPGRTDGLKYYFTSKTQISSTHIIERFEDAKKVITSNQPDAIIFVGIQNDFKNYEIMNINQIINKKTFISMYAHVDIAVKSICQIYGINNYFDDKLPVSEYVRYLKAMIDRT